MWLSRRRRGENTNLSALFLSGSPRSRRAPLKKNLSPAAAPPPLAEPRSRRRVGASLRVSPLPRSQSGLSAQPEGGGWTRREGRGDSGVAGTQTGPGAAGPKVGAAAWGAPGAGEPSAEGEGFYFWSLFETKGCFSLLVLLSDRGGWGGDGRAQKGRLPLKVRPESFQNPTSSTPALEPLPLPAVPPAMPFGSPTLLTFPRTTHCAPRPPEGIF